MSGAVLTAIFAGGCFWCMEPPFDKVPGVVSTVSGYTGGSKDKPSYTEVSSGDTGHREVIQVTYDPAKVSYSRLLEVYWHNIDPVDARGQFCDKGFQYTSAIYYQGAEQQKLAVESKGAIEKSLKAKAATALVAATAFYPAEDYHQDYYKKNPVRYKYYRYSCGRDQRLKEVWGGG